MVEHNRYSRIELKECNLDVMTLGTTPDMHRPIGIKRYELTDHLGNVLSVVSDKKQAVDDGVYNSSGVKTSSTADGTIDYYRPSLHLTTAYYPFGMQMPGGLDYNAGSYRYGYNGKEMDNEIDGVVGSKLDFGARIYDSRIGRFFNTDPKKQLLLHLSPFQYALNSPIQTIDSDGEFPILINGKVNEDFERASALYWDADILKIISRRTGYSVDLYQGSNKGYIQFSNDFYLVDGDKGRLFNTRKKAGFIQGKLDAQNIWNKMKENLNKEGQITEQLQVISHSRGTAFEEGYLESLTIEIIALAKKEGIGFVYDENNIVEYTLNISPHEANSSYFSNSGTKNINISHIGDLFSNDNAEGDVINILSIPEKDAGPISQHSNANFNTEIDFTLEILENNIDNSTLFNEVQRSYQKYDNKRKNGGESKVKKGKR